jgi:DNA polymerase-3 subunit beta
MKVICEKEELLKGLQIVLPIISSKSTLPILSNVLFETFDNKIKISSTDLEVAIKCYVKGEIIENGSITIPAKKFTGIVKELIDGKEIKIESNETNHINIESGKSKFILMGISKTEYPIIPEFQNKNTFVIKKETFFSMIKKNVFAVSKDSQRYVLNGILFVIEDSEFKMVATDSRRLTYTTITEIKTVSNCKAIVPIKAINNILRLLYDIKSEYIKITVTDNQLIIEIDNVTFFSMLIEGIFPNYEQVIPKKNKLKVKLKVKDTLAAVKQMAILTEDRILSDRSTAIKLYFDYNVLKISASTVGLGSGEIDLEIKYEEEPIEINFNPNFIKEVLQNINEDFIIFEFTNSLNSAVIHPEIDRNYIYVVMPMRV